MLSYIEQNLLEQRPELKTCQVIASKSLTSKLAEEMLSLILITGPSLELLESLKTQYLITLLVTPSITITEPLSPLFLTIKLSLRFKLPELLISSRVPEFEINLEVDTSRCENCEVIIFLPGENSLFPSKCELIIVACMFAMKMMGPLLSEKLQYLICN